MKRIAVATRLKTWRNGLRGAFAGDPWEASMAGRSWLQRRIVKLRRIAGLIARGFREDNLPLHAAALTYNTLLALIPSMAVGLWILRGVGAAEMAKQRIMQAIEVMPEEFQDFIADALAYVDNTDFATLGGIGLLILVWTAVDVLGRIEASFNKVWAVQVNRGFLRKTADYVSVLVVVPILIVAATTINATMSSEVLTTFIEERMGFSGMLLYRRALAVMPWAGAWLALAFMNIYIPNTRVRALPGLVSGLIGGSLWILWQLLYLRFQFGIAKYNAIYGTFASVPIFLVWVYVSWQIVLLSAEVAFGIQHRNTYRRDRADAAADLRSRYLLMLAVLARAAGNLLRHRGPLDGAAFAAEAEIPARQVNEAVNRLTRAGYLAEVAEPRGAVVLLRSPETVRLRDLLALAMQAGGVDNAAAPADILPARFQAAWTKLEREMNRAVGEGTLRDFVEETEDAQPAPEVSKGTNPCAIPDANVS